VLALAHHLAEFYGLKVLAIEVGARGDFAEILDLDRYRTFDGYADGRMTAIESVQFAYGLSVIPAGRTQRTVAEFTTRLRQLLKDVGRDFDPVLLDLPPVLESTDELVIGAVVPELVLVVEAGRTRYEVVQRAQRQLDAEGVKIIATVLNKHRRFIPGWLYRWLMG